jgi:hypothetical protein
VSQVSIKSYIVFDEQDHLGFIRNRPMLEPEDARGHPL